MISRRAIISFPGSVRVLESYESVSLLGSSDAESA